MKERGAERGQAAQGPQTLVILLQGSPKQLLLTPSSALLMPKSRTFIQRGNKRGCFVVGNYHPR